MAYKKTSPAGQKPRASKTKSGNPPVSASPTRKKKAGKRKPPPTGR